MSISNAIANIIYNATKKRLCPKNILPTLSLIDMTRPVNGLCSTSITSPSIQSACAVSCGLTFILSPIFGSIVFCVYVGDAKINIFPHTSKFPGKKNIGDSIEAITDVVIERFVLPTLLLTFLHFYIYLYSLRSSVFIALIRLIAFGVYSSIITLSQ